MEGEKDKLTDKSSEEGEENNDDDKKSAAEQFEEDYENKWIEVVTTRAEERHTGGMIMTIVAIVVLTLTLNLTLSKNRVDSGKIKQTDFESLESVITQMEYDQRNSTILNAESKTILNEIGLKKTQAASERVRAECITVTANNATVPYVAHILTIVH